LCTSTGSPKGQQIVTVCLTGSPDLVHKSREAIYNDTPISLVRLSSILVYFPPPHSPNSD
jgi:hypothetical protein